MVLLLGMIGSLLNAETTPQYRLSIVQPEFKHQFDNNGTSIWCEYVAERLEACLLKKMGSSLKYVPLAERPKGDWKTLIDGEIKPETYQTQFVSQPIKGTTSTYYARGLQDGLDGFGWLYPISLRDMVGSEVLVAQPMSGAFFVWSKDSMEANKIMAIAIKELYSTADKPVSPYIYHWKDEEWTVWGEAVKKSPKP